MINATTVALFDRTPLEGPSTSSPNAKALTGLLKAPEYRWVTTYSVDQTFCTEMQPRTPPQPIRMASVFRTFQITGRNDSPVFSLIGNIHQSRPYCAGLQKHLRVQRQFFCPMVTGLSAVGAWNETEQTELPRTRTPFSLIFSCRDKLRDTSEICGKTPDFQGLHTLLPEKQILDWTVF